MRDSKVIAQCMQVLMDNLSVEDQEWISLDTLSSTGRDNAYEFMKLLASLYASASKLDDVEEIDDQTLPGNTIDMAKLLASKYSQQESDFKQDMRVFARLAFLYSFLIAAAEADSLDKAKFRYDYAKFTHQLSEPTIGTEISTDAFSLFEEFCNSPELYKMDNDNSKARLFLLSFMNYLRAVFDKLRVCPEVKKLSETYNKTVGGPSRPKA